MATAILAIATKAAEWVGMTVFQTATGAGLSLNAAATLANIAYYATSGLVYVGTLAGVNALTRPNLPDPGEGTEPTNQTRPEIQMGTGRARLSGPRLMWESIPGWNIEIIALHDGPVDGFETIYLNDDVVTVDEDGWVQPLDGGRYGDQSIRILFKTGAPGEGPFQEIIDLCAAAGLSDLYDADCHAHGVARAAVLCKAVADKNVLKIYPNGGPKFSVVTRMSRVYDWRDPAQDLMDPTTWAWGENAQVNQVHWEWLLRWLPMKVGSAGWIQGDGRPPPDWCLDVWNREIAPHLDALTASANLCDEAVPLKGGASEPRYRQGGWWRAMNQPADIRRKYLDCYDGRMCETGSGAFLFSPGKYEAPTYILSDRNMVVSAWNRGAPDREQTNVLTADFTSPEHDWSRQPSDAWRDEDLISRQGEKAASIDLTWVHSHGQARRLLKRLFSRANASHHGPVEADLEGLNAIERRYIKLSRRSGPQSMRDVTVEVMRARIDLMNGRVPLEVIRADPNIDSWNPATEEGTAPPTTARAPRVVAPTPVIVSVTPETAGGLTRLRIVVEGPGRPGLELSARTRPTGAVSWNEKDNPVPPTVVDDGLEFTTGEVDPVALDVQAAFWTGGEAGDWSGTATANAEPSPAQDALAAYLDAMAVQPSPTRAGRYYELIKALMDAGVWAKTRALYLHAAHDSQAARINMKAPSEIATAVNSPAFTASRGYQGNGTTSYVETGFDPSDGDALFTLNSAHMGVWTLTEGQEAEWICGNATAQIVPRNTSDRILTRANTTEIDNAVTASALGHTAWVRTDSANTRTFRNGVMVEAETSSSVAFIANVTFRVCGSDNTGADSFSNKQVAAFHFGATLTDSEMAAFHAALNDYLTAVGALF